MSWADAAMSLRASRNVYGMGGVTCNISNVGGGGGGVGKYLNVPASLDAPPAVRPKKKHKPTSMSNFDAW